MVPDRRPLRPSRRQAGPLRTGFTIPGNRAGEAGPGASPTRLSAAPGQRQDRRPGAWRSRCDQHWYQAARTVSPCVLDRAGTGTGRTAARRPSAFDDAVRLALFLDGYRAADRLLAASFDRRARPLVVALVL